MLSAAAVDGNGWTDLHYAVALGWAALAPTLLAVRAPVDAPLRTDGETLSPRLLSTLSRRGQNRLPRFRRVGATPLHIAAAADAHEVVARLLEGGADPDVAEATTATPLHYAAAGHGGRVAAVLAAHGTDVEAATAKGAGRGLGGGRVAGPRSRCRGEEPRGRYSLHPAASGDAAVATAVLLHHGANTPRVRGRRRYIETRAADNRQPDTGCRTATPKVARVA